MDTREIFLLHTTNRLTQKERHAIFTKEALDPLIKKWNQIKKENPQKTNNQIQSVINQEIQIITINSPGYPALLKEIYDPPLCLFVKGSLRNNIPFLSIVGTRKPSEYGKFITKEFTKIAAEHYGIISGLAHGIDSIAHETTLEQSGYTVAVIAHGHNQHSNRGKRLADQILKQGGAIISEHIPEIPPEKFRFPIRNRIIAGIAQYTLVPEATKKSGTRITAAIALRENREILAIPGPITQKQSEGTNELIAQGAHCIYSKSSLKEILNIDSAQQELPIIKNPTEEALLKTLKEIQTLDSLMEKSKLNPGELLQALQALKEKEVIRELPGQRYQKIHIK